MASFATNLGSSLTKVLLQSDHHHAAELRKELSKIKLKFAAVHHASPGSTFGTWYSCAQTPYTSHISMGYVSWHMKLKNMRFRSVVKKWLPQFYREHSNFYSIVEKFGCSSLTTWSSIINQIIVLIKPSLTTYLNGKFVHYVIIRDILYFILCLRTEFDAVCRFYTMFREICALSTHFGQQDDRSQIDLSDEATKVTHVHLHLF